MQTGAYAQLICVFVFAYYCDKAKTGNNNNDNNNNNNGKKKKICLRCGCNFLFQDIGTLESRMAMHVCVETDTVNTAVLFRHPDAKR